MCVMYRCHAHIYFLSCYWLITAWCIICWFSMPMCCVYLTCAYGYSLCKDICFNVYITTFVLKALVLGYFYFGRVWCAWRHWFLTISTLGGCGGLEETHLELIFILRRCGVVLKRVINWCDLLNNCLYICTLLHICVCFCTVSSCQVFLVASKNFAHIYTNITCVFTYIH